ncbi:SDR family NAD(P)-dependent oxidoreductase [Luteimicrobium subarcticum]|uniref:Short-subunit dehydrogenase n=1 Tax=Luteimicrobium subarcticum TaxID=620910 RepID=A0A2M8W1U5_9MICO|nr:SDR family NAD(P)-dependent oxidoreductase [Luteimicrobium subarcticum]PJI84890.1 short-subunit dehydrogenase [Luteimicrobium subarcticum]
MRTVVITGASDGIGAAATKLLARREPQDVRLVLVGRSPDKTRAVAERIGAEHHVADYERLDDVRQLAATLLRECDRIDVLAHNAGGIFSGPVRTADGFERTFQVDHLAPTLLTHELLGRLLESRASVVSTASVAARVLARPDLDDLETWHRFTPNRAYGNAKLANVVFTAGLHERFHEQGLSSVAFHPGIVATGFAADTTSVFRRLYHGVLRPFLTSPQQGGANLAHFVTGEAGVDWQSGAYYDQHRRLGRTHRVASDPAFVREHWERSAQLLGIRW